MGITAKYVGNTRQMKNFQGKRPCDPYMQILLTFKRNWKSGGNGYESVNEFPYAAAFRQRAESSPSRWMAGRWRSCYVISCICWKSLCGSRINLILSLRSETTDSVEEVCLNEKKNIFTGVTACTNSGMSGSGNIYCHSQSGLSECLSEWHRKQPSWMGVWNTDGCRGSEESHSPIYRRVQLYIIRWKLLWRDAALWKKNWQVRFWKWVEAFLVDLDTCE